MTDLADYDTTVGSTPTGRRDLQKGLRFLKFRSSNAGTDPAPEGDFALVLAINEALFTGLSDLVLDNRPYPFKLVMPKLPGWKNFISNPMAN